MRRSGWLVMVTMMMALSGLAAADTTTDSATDARIKALEARVAQLENRLTAVVNAQKASATAAVPAPAPAGTAAAAASTPTTPSVPSSVALARWKDHAAWETLERGMSWSQVTATLGHPGSKTTGVFGDVWFYPDSSGGRVVFDRDSRVSSWSEPGSSQ